MSSGQANKYTPPARRAPSANATVPGAPVDPAILSSTIARPDSAAAKAAQQTAAPTTEKSTTPVPAPTAIVPSQPEAPKEAPSQAENKAPVAEKPVAAAAKPVIAAIPPRKAAKPHDATTNVEHDLLDSFKAFSAAEKLRMSERQRSIARENKAVKLNDLKKFALNFKLSTPVPTDLVPILAKDDTKQAVIVEKALKQAAIDEDSGFAYELDQRLQEDRKRAWVKQYQEKLRAAYFNAISYDLHVLTGAEDTQRSSLERPRTRTPRLQQLKNLLLPEASEPTLATRSTFSTSAIHDNSTPQSLCPLTPQEAMLKTFTATGKTSAVSHTRVPPRDI